MTIQNSDLVDAVATMTERVGVDTTTPAPRHDTALWAALTEAGFTEIGIPEEHGGSGGDFVDVLSVVHALTARGALTGLTEHTALASRIVAACTGRPAVGLATLAFADQRCTARETADGTLLDGVVTDVVHGSDAAVLVVVLPAFTEAHRPSVAIVALDAPGITVQRGSDLLGTAMDDYSFEAVHTRLFESPFHETELEQSGALAYAVALTAAAGAVRDRTLRYAAERIQFGRPLAEFQAIQQKLASLTALTALMETATEAAATTHGANRRTAVAAAKAVTSSSAREIAAAGHQIHGALGFTSEHSLGRFTTALWSWRDRYGSERHWSEVLAGQILDAGADPWDLITGVHTTADVTEGISS